MFFKCKNSCPADIYQDIVSVYEMRVWVKTMWGNGVDCLKRAEPMFMKNNAPPLLMKISKSKLTNTSSRTSTSHLISLVRSFQCCHSHLYTKLWLYAWITWFVLNGFLGCCLKFTKTNGCLLPRIFLNGMTKMTIKC